MTRIAIVGGSGFIGTRFCQALQQAGQEFRIIDKRVSEIFPDSTVLADVTRLDTLPAAFDGCDAIVNLAAERRADAVTAGNGYLAERARNAGCARVEIVPTVVDLDRYAIAPKRAEATVPVIGWIGSPATAGYLQLVAPVIECLRGRYPLRAVAIGARPDQVAGTPFEAIPWSAAGEAAQVAAFDIGIMPLLDTPWERGKCGYKLIQYMACGVPVIASPIGVNQEIVAHGVNGFLAGSPDEWKHALATLMADPGLRTRMGTAGRCKAEAEYSLQAWGAKVAALVSALGN